MHASCLPLNPPIPQGRTTVQQSEVNGAVYLRDRVCYRRSGPMNYRSVRVKWAVYVSVCAVDTKEAWQTCPLSADGGIHNSIWRQFHAVSLPLSSQFPETDKEHLATEKREGLQVVSPPAQQSSTPTHHHHNTHAHTNGRCKTEVICLHVFLWSILIVWQYDNVTIIIDVCNKAWPLTRTFHYWGIFWYMMCHKIAWNQSTAATL